MTERGWVPWQIFKDDDGVWVVRKRYLPFIEAPTTCAEFSSGAEAIAAFAAGGR